MVDVVCDVAVLALEVEEVLVDGRVFEKEVFPGGFGKTTGRSTEEEEEGAAASFFCSIMSLVFTDRNSSI